jgi:hypothetical protein
MLVLQPDTAAPSLRMDPILTSVDSRIASPGMLPKDLSLPQLKCSPAVDNRGNRDRNRSLRSFYEPGWQSCEHIRRNNMPGSD